MRKTALVVLFFLLLASAISAQAKRIYSEEGIDYAPKAAQFVLSAADLTENLDYIEYSIDGGEMVRYVEPIRIEEEGEHVGYAYAVDNVGNRSETFEARGFVDNTAPAVSVLPSNPFRTFGGERYLRSGTEIIVRANDRLSGVQITEVSVNGRPFQSYTAPIQVTESGFYSIRGRAIDRVGNTSREQQISFYVGVETPEPSIQPFVD